MATITKLGQTFVAKTEATAASQNIQNAKIDELIDIFGKETTGNTKTIAIPFTKDSSTVKVITLGTNLSVSGNTLNATIPTATDSSLGGVKVGDGLSIGASGSTAGVLKVEHDSTLKMTDGVLGVANPGGGGVTMDQVNSAITTALSEYAKTSDLSSYATTSSLSSYVKKTDATLSTVGGNGKYVQSVSQSNGKISATAVDFPFSLGTDIKYYVTTSENNYSNIGATIQTGSFNTAINVTNGLTLVLMLAPSANISMITDTLGTDIKSQFKAAGLTINSNKFYQVYYYSPGGNVAGSYTVKTT